MFLKDNALAVRGYTYFYRCNYPKNISLQRIVSIIRSYLEFIGHSTPFSSTRVTLAICAVKGLSYEEMHVLLMEIVPYIESEAKGELNGSETKEKS